MFLGRYDFSGDADSLLAAYDRLMTVMPPGDLLFHACVVTGEGIAVVDACPSAEVFAQFSTSPEVLGAMAGAGLPSPRVTPLGDIHAVRVAPGVLADAG